MKLLKHFFSILVTTLFWLTVAIALAVLFFSLREEVTDKVPFKSYVVQSGSMEPAIAVGDLLLISPAASYTPREVITFRDNQNRVVTHRVLEVKEAGSNPANKYNYLTKGDANQTPDAILINQTQVIGKVVQVIPKVGLLITFARSTVGIIVLLVIPTTLILLDELLQIIRVVRQKKSKKRANNSYV